MLLGGCYLYGGTWGCTFGHNSIRPECLFITEIFQIFLEWLTWLIHWIFIEVALFMSVLFKISVKLFIFILFDQLFFFFWKISGRSLKNVFLSYDLFLWVLARGISCGYYSCICYVIFRVVFCIYFKMSLYLLYVFICMFSCIYSCLLRVGHIFGLLSIIWLIVLVRFYVNSKLFTMNIEI